MITEAVPFARHRARFTADFEDLVVWLVTRSDKSTVAAFARVAWRTVGAMCEPVAAEKLDPTRLAALVDIGVDEISWRYEGDLTTGSPPSRRRSGAWVCERRIPSCL